MFSLIVWSYKLYVGRSAGMYLRLPFTVREKYSTCDTFFFFTSIFYSIQSLFKNIFNFVWPFCQCIYGWEALRNETLKQKFNRNSEKNNPSEFLSFQHPKILCAENSKTALFAFLTKKRGKIWKLPFIRILTNL